MNKKFLMLASLLNLSLSTLYSMESNKNTRTAVTESATTTEYDEKIAINKLLKEMNNIIIERNPDITDLAVPGPSRLRTANDLLKVLPPKSPNDDTIEKLLQEQGVLKLDSTIKSSKDLMAFFQSLNHALREIPEEKHIEHYLEIAIIREYIIRRVWDWERLHNKK